MEVIDGVFRIAVPTPFPVGRVNAYLIAGDSVTLIDCGPNSDKSLVELLHGFELAGIDVASLEQILLTHGHIDHTGLVSAVCDEVEKRGGTRPNVWLHKNDHHRVIDHEKYIRSRVRSYIEIVERGGAPQEILDHMPYDSLVRRFMGFGRSIPHAFALGDGQVFDSAVGPLTCMWVPGHTLGSVCFIAEEQQVLFSGDHLLSDISSNPSLDFDRSSDIMMLRYLDSLSALERYGDYLALPGHRAAISNTKSRISELRADIFHKLERMEELLSDSRQTIYQLSRGIYGQYGIDQIVLALAETMDLVRVLEANQKTIISDMDGVITVSKRSAY